MDSSNATTTVTRIDCGDVNENMECVVFNIPDELLLYIFQHVCLRTRIVMLPLVCRRWHRVSRDSTLFKQIDLRIRPGGIFLHGFYKKRNAHKRRSFFNFLSKVARPLELRLQSFDVPDEDWRCIGELCNRLTLLQLSHCPLKGEALKKLLEGCAASLHILELECVNCIEECVGLQCLYPLAEKLHTLHLRDSCGLCDLCLAALSALPQLRTFNMGRARFFDARLPDENQPCISDDGLVNFLSSAAGSRLQYLALPPRCELVPVSIQLLFTCCSQLSALELCRASDEVIELMTRLEGHHLREFYIEDASSVSSTSLVRLAQSDILSKINHLRFGMAVHLRDAALCAVFEVAGATLLTVELRGARLITVHILETIVWKCPKLVALRCSYCPGLATVLTGERLTKLGRPNLLMLYLLRCQGHVLSRKEQAFAWAALNKDWPHLATHDGLYNCGPVCHKIVVQRLRHVVLSCHALRTLEIEP